ncbi:MAG TPA: phosphoribosylformylglycinamidine synthase subunit PurS [Candidatus Kryptonia bacterium]
MFKAVVKVNLKKKILDPQGKAIESSLHNLGFGKLGSVRTGRTIEISVDETDTERALGSMQAACRKLLANPVTEDYELDMFDEKGNLLQHFSSVKSASTREKVGA